jgi:hypothetical protein
MKINGITVLWFMIATGLLAYAVNYGKPKFTIGVIGLGVQRAGICTAE